MRAYLTRDDQLVVRDAVSTDAVALWQLLHQIYLERRGPDPRARIPATTYLDVLEVVTAFEGLAQSIRHSAVRGLDDWRHGFVRTLELVARAPDRRAVFPHNDVVWLALTQPLAEYLDASAPRSDAWTISL